MPRALHMGKWKNWCLISEMNQIHHFATHNCCLKSLGQFRVCPTTSQNWSEHRQRTFPGVNGNYAGLYITYTLRTEGRTEDIFSEHVSKTTRNETCMGITTQLQTKSPGAPDSLHKAEFAMRHLRSHTKDQSKGLIEFRGLPVHVCHIELLIQSTFILVLSHKKE